MKLLNIKHKKSQQACLGSNALRLAIHVVQGSIGSFDYLLGQILCICYNMKNPFKRDTQDHYYNHNFSSFRNTNEEVCLV